MVKCIICNNNISFLQLKRKCQYKGCNNWCHEQCFNKSDKVFYCKEHNELDAINNILQEELNNNFIMSPNKSIIIIMPKNITEQLEMMEECAENGYTLLESTVGDAKIFYIKK